ncbi:MAG: hypothetical protein ABI718_05190 [Acidobacteriota bacterium]
MNIDYSSLETDMETGLFRQNLEKELTIGFRDLHDRGEPLPRPSHYASRIAEIVYQAAERPITSENAYYLYQEILSACESALATVMGEPQGPVSPQ